MFFFFFLALSILWLPQLTQAEGLSRVSRGQKVAVFLDLTGAQSSLGQPAMNGFLLALQEFNALNQVNLYAAPLNTKSDPMTAQRIAKRVLPDLSVGTGFTDNDAVLLAGRLFQESRIPFLTIGATDPALPDIIGQYIFLLPFGDNAQAAAAAEFTLSEFGSTAAILFDSTAQYSRTLPKYFRMRFEELGGHVLLDEGYNGGCDISQKGQEITTLSIQPAFVYLAGLPDCIGEVISSLRSSGVSQPIIGGDGLDTPNLLIGKEGPSNDVWYTTHAWLDPDSGTMEAQQFIEAYQRAYGHPPEDAFAALGYDAAKLLGLVLQGVKPNRPQAIKKRLEHIQNFQGVTGTISYTRKNHVPKKTVWIIEVEDGERSLAASFTPDTVPSPILPPKTPSPECHLRNGTKFNLGTWRPKSHRFSQGSGNSALCKERSF